MVEFLNVVMYLGLQTERFRIGIILDPNPFLNNYFGFESKSILLVPNHVPIGKLGFGSGTEST